MRGELDWLRSGPLFRVRNEAAGRLNEFLARAGYQVVELDGSVMASRDAAHAELRRAFDLPDWCGHNWDAFADAFREFVDSHQGVLVAVVWRDVDVAARLAPATATEVGWALIDAAWAYRYPGDPAGILEMDVFVLGEGPDFDAPDAD